MRRLGFLLACALAVAPFATPVGAVAKKDADAQSWLLIGELQKNANKSKEARTAYDKALASSSNKELKKKALRSLADLALATADNEAANEYFKQFLALDPSNAQL